MSDPTSEQDLIPAPTAATAHRPRGYVWFGLGGCGLFLAALILLFFLAPTLLGVNVLAAIVDTARSLANPPTTARVETRGTIISGIQAIGQLVSISVQLAEPEIRVGVQQGGLNACGFLATHVAQGTIEGGVDLSRITDESVIYDAGSNTYTIHLPAPQLTSCRIDFIRQYNRSTTICNVDWDGARVIAGYQALVGFRDDALESGILERAKIEARLVIGNFVDALTGSRVMIVFDETGTTALPASCAPPVPDGWTYLEESGQWVKTS